MKKIKLSQGKYTLVDDTDYLELSKYKWCVNLKGSHYYAVRNVYPERRDKPVMVYMHRAITGAPDDKSFVVDHIDGNTLDNCRSNLRVVTRAVNLANRLAIAA